MTTAQVIESLVGTWSATDHRNLYQDAFSFIADLIPTNSILWNTANLNMAQSLLVEDTSAYKIIKVTRTDGSDEREAQEISWNDYLRGQDADSIFYHAGSGKYPVWAMSQLGDVLVSPAGGVKRIFYFTYPIADYSTSDAEEINTTLNGYPKEAHYAACIKAGMNILYTKISDAAQDEEDAEQLAILQNQLSALQSLLQAELQQLNIPTNIEGIDHHDVK